MALNLRLHAFDDDLRSQFVGHHDDGLAQFHCVRVRLQAPGKGPVDHEVVRVEILEIGQRRVAGAEVVDGDLNPDVPECLQLGVDQRLRIQPEAFGDLDYDPELVQADVAKMLKAYSLDALIASVTC